MTTARSFRLDIDPLRVNRDFRLLFISGLVTGLGSFATYVAMPFQIADLTGSYVAVGILGVCEIVPLVTFGLWGGVLADRVDRRKMILWTEVAFVLVVLALVANSSTSEPHVWIIYVASMLLAALDGLQRPSLDAVLPRIVPAGQLAAAGALHSLRGNIAHIAGPAIGGVLIAIGTVRSAYVFDVLTFLVSASCVAQLREVPAVREAFSRPLDEMKEAFAYLKSRRDLIGTYVVDVVAMVMAFPFALFPFIASERGAPWSLGFLYSSFAVGSLVATLTSGWTRRVHHHGRALVGAAFVWGVAIALSSTAPSIYWVLVCFCLAGAADMVSGLFRSLMWNLTIPADIRGRMAGIEMLSYTVGPQAGQVRASLTARFTSVRMSLFTGGIACAACVASLPRALPELWRFDASRHSIDEPTA